MNKKIVAAGLILGGVTTIFSNQRVDGSEVNIVKPVQTVTQTKKENTKIIETESGFKTLTRVTVAPTLKPQKQLHTKATIKPQKTITKKIYSSVPFTAKFQKWIDNKCKEYGISTNVVMGVIETESKFTINAMGDNGEAYGLMQIQKKWHKKRMQKVNAVNLLNCYDNVHVGVDYLAELYKANNKNWHKALMAYNGGQAYANRRVKNGIYSSEYSRNVMERAYKYKTERND